MKCGKRKVSLKSVKKRKWVESWLEGSWRRHADLWKLLQQLPLYFPRLEYKYVSLPESKQVPKDGKLTIYIYVRILRTRTNFSVFMKIQEYDVSGTTHITDWNASLLFFSVLCPYFVYIISWEDVWLLRCFRISLQSTTSIYCYLNIWGLACLCIELGTIAFFKAQPMISTLTSSYFVLKCVSLPAVGSMIHSTDLPFDCLGSFFLLLLPVKQDWTMYVQLSKPDNFRFKNKLKSWCYISTERTLRRQKILLLQMWKSAFTISHDLNR